MGQNKRIAVPSLLAVTFAASTANAAPPYVDRTQTLPTHDWAFDMAMAVGHISQPNPLRDYTGPGLNLEMAVSVVRHLELGFREGLSFGDEGKITGAGSYARLYDWKTFETGFGTFSNPEFRIRGQLVEHDVVELSLEGRAVMPFANNTHFGSMFGVPLSFHLGRIARLDTGGYIGIVFDDPRTRTDIILPLDAWFQITDAFWLGPRVGYVISNPGSNGRVPLGFGFGYQFASFGDFKAGFLFPAVDGPRGSSVWGIGAGVQLRIE